MWYEIFSERRLAQPRHLGNIRSFQMDLFPRGFISIVSEVNFGIAAQVELAAKQVQDGPSCQHSICAKDFRDLFEAQPNMQQIAVISVATTQLQHSQKMFS